MLILSCVCLTLIFALYILYPYRQRKDLEYYVSVVSLFEKQTNALIEVYTSQHTEYDEIMGSNEKISKSQYKIIIEDTYKYVIKYIPEHIRNKVLVYLKPDEIKEWILFKINIMYSEKYAESLVDDDSLMEYNSKDSLKDFSIQQTFQDLADKFSDNQKKVR